MEQLVFNKVIDFLASVVEERGNINFSYSSVDFMFSDVRRGFLRIRLNGIGPESYVSH